MKITFIGAGSTVFAKNVLGDCLLAENLPCFEIALLDIDAERLEDSFVLISKLRDKYKPAVTVKKYLATDETQTEEAFAGANYVINAIQVGGYDPCTITDFEIPKKYGLRQTIADTLGIGGIFRGLRTIPVMKKYADIMEKVCPNALLLNYTNPMSILTGYMQQYTKVKTVGLCHSCQVVVSSINEHLKLPELKDARFTLAGINHMCWLSNMLMVTDKVNGAADDIAVSPVNRSYVALAYYIASYLSTLLVCFVATGAGFVYMAVMGWYLTVFDVFLILLDIAILVMFGTALSSIINFFLSSQGQISAVGTIVSSCYGFICGAYMPISQFNEGLQTIITLLPGTYATSLIRNHCMNGALNELENIGLPESAIEEIRSAVDCNIVFFEQNVSIGTMYAIILTTVAILITAYILLNKFKGSKVK